MTPQGMITIALYIIGFIAGTIIGYLIGTRRRR